MGKKLPSIFSTIAISLLLLLGVPPTQANAADNDVFPALYKALAEHYSGKPLPAEQVLRSTYEDAIKQGSSPKDAVARLLSSLGDDRFTMPSAVDLKTRQTSSYVGLAIGFVEVQVCDRDVLIQEVQKDSPAEAAGLQPGDRLYAVDGRRVNGLKLDDIKSLIALGEVGAPIALTIDRNGLLINIACNRDLDFTIGVLLNLDKTEKLVEINYLRDGGPAKLAGLKTGDIITAIDGQSLSGVAPESVGQMLRKGSIGTTFQFTVLRDQKEVRVNAARQLVKSWDNSFGFRSQSGTNLDWSCISLTNFDWLELVETVDRYVPELPQANILDLRDASGHDPEIASRVAARFLPGDGRVLSLKETVAGTEQETRYEVSGGKLVKTNATGSTVLETIPHRYQGKLVILVNDRTTGTPAAIAQYLHRTTGATIVGKSTDSRDYVRTYYQLGDDLVVGIPTGTLQSFDGGSLKRVAVNRSVFFDDNMQDEAVAELEGYQWYHSVNLWLLVVAALIVAVTVRLVIVQARRQAKVVETEQPEPQEAVEVEETIAPTSGNSVRNPRRDLLALGIVFGCLFLFFGGVYLVQRKLEGPPSGTTVRVSVEAYVTGSKASELQSKVIEELKGEYTGDIEFSITDVRVHKAIIKELYDKEDVELDNYFPAVRVAVTYYDKNGQQLSRGWNAGGYSTKRNLVRSIESAKNQNRRFWPNPTIERK